jgi:hypothetical protein
MNLFQQAKKVWPGLTETELDTLMWACTEYPEGLPEDVLRDLKSVYEKSGGDLMQALHQQDLAISRRFTFGR